jgi:membrane associated rhomboid family serine protease
MEARESIKNGSPMGIHDRDYLQSERRPGTAMAWITQSAVGAIIFLNLVAWMLQLVTREPRGGGFVTDFLSAEPQAVFDFQLWKLVTANFAHDPDRVQHILWNMLFLFFCGREVEHVYGRRDFFILYLVAGVLAVLAEVTVLHAGGRANPVLGASGAVFAIVVVFAMLYPRRTVLFMFFLPVPVWLLCTIWIAVDVLGLLSPTSDGIAHFAHLAGALAGFTFKHFDLRWARLRAAIAAEPGERSRSRTPARKTRERAEQRRARVRKTVACSGDSREERRRPEPDPISERIDDLLGKIHTQGKDSLTDEELKFLKENSGRYRSG